MLQRPEEVRSNLLWCDWVLGGWINGRIGLSWTQQGPNYPGLSDRLCCQLYGITWVVLSESCSESHRAVNKHALCWAGRSEPRQVAGSRCIVWPWWRTRWWSVQRHASLLTRQNCSQYSWYWYTLTNYLIPSFMYLPLIIKRTLWPLKSMLHWLNTL